MKQMWEMKGWELGQKRFIIMYFHHRDTAKHGALKSSVVDHCYVFSAVIKDIKSSTPK